MQEKIAGIAVAFGTGILTNNITMPYLGVGLTTVVGAALGAAAAVAYDEPKLRAHGRTYALVFATVISASLLAGFLPHLMGWDWSSRPGAETSIAGIAALILYYFMPPAGKRIGELIRAFKLRDVLPGRRPPDDFGGPPL